MQVSSIPNFASLHPGLIHAAHIKGGGALIDATVTFHAAPTRATACRRSGRGRAYGRARLPALRRGTCGSERTPPLSFSPHFLGPGVIGCYPHLACLFSAASCLAVPVVVPDGRIRRSRPGAGYEAARGNRTRSVSGIVSRNALTRASLFSVTEEGTNVNAKVTTIVLARFLPRAAAFYPGFMCKN